MAKSLQRAIEVLDQLLAKAQDVKSQNLQVPVAHSSIRSQTNAQKRLTTQPKPATSQKAQPANVASSVIGAEAFAKAKLVIGLIKEVEEVPNSDKLLRCQVQVGPDQQRQIIAGLRKHIGMEELSGRLVVIVANLKTAKLAGETSEGMILAAVSKGSQYENGELVYPLSAPASALPGESVFLSGSEPSQAYPKECKQWKKLLPSLAVQSSSAAFDGIPLACASGIIKVKEGIPDGASIG